MVRNYKTLTTLLRNRINRNAAEQAAWLHEKGVALQIDEENIYSLQTEKEGHKSEFVELCYNGLIYRGPELVCYKGPRVPQMSLKKAKDLKSIMWNSKTIFAERIEGKRIYMYWDPERDDWGFADDKKPYNNVYSKILKEKLYNIYNLEYFFTFVFVVPEENNSGIYLERMYENKSGKEVEWKTVWNYAQRLKAKRVQYYYFEGFDKLEPEDFPIYVIDISKNRILLKEM